MYKPDSLWTWTFLLLTVVQGAVIVALQVYAFVVFEQSLYPEASSDTNFLAPAVYSGEQPRRFVYTRTIPFFLALYIFAVIYQIILTVDALRLRNVIQIIGLCILNFCLMLYGAIQKVQIEDALNQLGDVIHKENIKSLSPLEVAVPCIIAVGLLAMIFVAWKLYQEFAWTIYKSISADLRMKRRYLTYQVYIALLKFDFFFFLGFTIQFLVVLQATTSPTGQVDYEFYLTVAALPVTVVILLLAAVFVRKESIAGTVFIVFFYLAGLAYFIFKVTRIWVPSDKRQYYSAVAKPLTTFAAFDIVLLTITVIVCIMSSLNFNKGLRSHLTRSGSTRKAEAEESKNFHQPYQQYQPHMEQNLTYPGAPVPSRMTIE